MSPRTRPVKPRPQRPSGQLRTPLEAASALKPPHPLDMLRLGSPGEPQWPTQLGRVCPWIIHYLAWDGETARKAVVVLPTGWGPNNHPGALPLVISPHGRNNFGWNNAVVYWQDLPADGPFALICPDGLARARSAATDPYNLPPDPSLFTYGNPGHIDDLARMPSIVQETLPWLEIDLEQIYVLGSSMGGQETLLLAARYPDALSGGTGRLAGAVAFDAPCDLATQCGYLTNLPLVGDVNPPQTASMMLEEVGSAPKSRAGWNQAAVFYNDKTASHMTIGQLLHKLPTQQPKWDERSPLNYVAQLASLSFPLKLYWSTNDTVVGNQATKQSGKLYTQIIATNGAADVEQTTGAWAHSTEFVPGDRLSDALRTLNLIT
jgi:pimeloyl-ACP methyl ester carboxylesterase